MEEAGALARWGSRKNGTGVVLEQSSGVKASSKGQARGPRLHRLDLFLQLCPGSHSSPATPRSCLCI